MQWRPGTTRESREEGTDLFFDVGLWILVLVPLLIVVALAAIKRKRTPELPHVDQESWEEEVAASTLPVVVHVHASWSIGDRVIENQVSKLAEESQSQLKVVWLDIDRNPGILERHPTLEKRTVALFVEGRLLWQGTGVHTHQEMQAEIREVLS